jgi:hypothetical protein
MQRIVVWLALAMSLVLSGAGASLAQAEDSRGDVRIIELEADAALRFMADGEQVRDIPVVPGESVRISIENIAGFEHSFWIGTDAELSEPGATTDVGIAAWSEGVRELAWTVPDDVDGLMFGCTVPGHYPLMNGCFTEARIGAMGTVERIGEPACEGAATMQLGTGSDRDDRRYELPQHGFAVTVPEPPMDPGSEWFVSTLTGTMEDRAGLERQIDDLAAGLPFDRDILASLLEAGEETGAVLVGAWWPGPDPESRAWPYEMWSIQPVPWAGATAGMIRDAWVGEAHGTDDEREIGVMTVPSGEVVYIHGDLRYPEFEELTGRRWSRTTYYLTDGSKVLALQAASVAPPEDRWLSFLESVEPTFVGD